jgi:hypothetical protein
MCMIGSQSNDARDLLPEMHSSLTATFFWKKKA